MTGPKGKVVHADAAIAARILRGDEQAFRQLFEHVYPRLYRFTLARVDADHALASDLVQQAILRVIERLESYRGEAALYTWICQVARNVIADHFRTRDRRSGRVTLLEDEPSVRAVLEALAAPALEQPEAQAWRRDLGRLVQATVDALPDRYGEVLELKYVDGLRVREIAERLALSEKAAESLLTRARSAFREAMLDFADGAEMLAPPGDHPV